MRAFLCLSLMFALISALRELPRLESGGVFRILDFVVTLAYISWAIYLLQVS